jgi:hypothetical protein
MSKTDIFKHRDWQNVIEIKKRNENYIHLYIK